MSILLLRLRCFIPSWSDGWSGCGKESEENVEDESSFNSISRNRVFEKIDEELARLPYTAIHLMLSPG